MCPFIANSTNCCINTTVVVVHMYSMKQTVWSPLTALPITQACVGGCSYYCLYTKAIIVVCIPLVRVCTSASKFAHCIHMLTVYQACSSCMNTRTEPECKNCARVLNCSFRSSLPTIQMYVMDALCCQVGTFEADVPLTQHMLTRTRSEDIQALK